MRIGCLINYTSISTNITTQLWSYCGSVKSMMHAIVHVEEIAFRVQVIKYLEIWHRNLWTNKICNNKMVFLCVFRSIYPTLNLKDKQIQINL